MICHTFANNFAGTYGNSGAHLNLKNEFWKQYEVYATKNNTLYDCLFSIDDVQKAILKLTTNKALGVNCLHPKHLIYAVNIIFNHLCFFNASIKHGCVPNSYSCSVIAPVVKDKLGDSSCCDNYTLIS